MNSIYSIIILAILSISSVYSQALKSDNAFKKEEISLADALQIDLYQHNYLKLDSLIIPNQSVLIPKNYSKLHFGVFCKLEKQLEKNTQFPIRFRLGNLDYVNKLEGKQ